MSKIDILRYSKELCTKISTYIRGDVSQKIDPVAVARRKEDIEAVDPVYYSTALMRTTERGTLQEVTNLIRKGADVNAKNIDGLTALYFAVQEGRKEIVEELLRGGAKVFTGYAVEGLNPWGAAESRAAIKMRGSDEILTMVKRAVFKEFDGNYEREYQSYQDRGNAHNTLRNLIPEILRENYNPRSEEYRNQHYAYNLVRRAMKHLVATSDSPVPRDGWSSENRGGREFWGITNG